MLGHPWRVIAATVLPCLVAIGLLPGTQLEMSFAVLMNQDEPLVERYFDLNEELALGARLVVLLDGPEEVLDSAVAAMDEALTPLEEVSLVLTESPVSWIEDRAPWLVDREIFDAWLRVSTRLDAVPEAQALRAQLEELDKGATMQLVEGSRVLLVKLAEDPIAQPMGKSSYRLVAARAQETVAPLGVTARFSGFPAIASEDQERTLGRLKVITPLCLLGVLMVLTRVEPRLLHLLIVGLPLVLSMGATLGLIGQITGKITMLESMFGVMIFGLGVDFALHLVNRMRDERARGLPFEEALNQAICGAGPGVVAGALTTVGAFTIIAFAPDPQAYRLGMAAAIGLSICLCLMLTLLPACWVVLHRRRPSDPQAPLVLSFVGRVSRLAAHHPKTVITAALVALGLGLVASTQYRVETDLSKVFNRDVPALEVAERVQEIQQLNYIPWILQTSDMAELREIHQELEAIDLLARVDSLAPLFPPDTAERARALEEAAVELGRMKRLYASMMTMAPRARAADLQEALRGVVALEKAALLGPPTLEGLPEVLRDQLISPSGNLLAFAYSADPNLDGLRLHQERLAVEAVHPSAAGFGNAVEGVMFIERSWIWTCFLLILAFVALLLAVDTRSLRWSLLTLVPVIFGTVLTLGVFCALGRAFNPIMVLSIPLIIGLGVDDGIHVVHRIREDLGQPVHESAAEVGRAIVMTTLTTSVSFGALMFTDHPGMESMALVLLVGLPFCLLASVTLLPALAVWMGMAEADVPEADVSETDQA